jgi:hypothetical protein
MRDHAIVAVQPELMRRGVRGVLVGWATPCGWEHRSRRSFETLTIARGLIRSCLAGAVKHGAVLGPGQEVPDGVPAPG